MKSIKESLVICLILMTIVINETYAQNSAVNVDQRTGSVNVIIPLQTISRGGINIPLSLAYSTSGIKIKDIDGDLGIGWNLVAGGQVSRQLRGLPDDCKKDNSNNDRVGWIYNNNGTAISNFSISNNGSTCANETNDLSYLNNFQDYSDTEPDIFNVSAPGLAFSFVFDNAKNIKTIPYADVIITPNYDATGQFISFSVVDDKGYTYQFAIPEQVTSTAQSGSGSAYFYQNVYHQFQNGITYNDSWYLQSITDSHYNKVVFNYRNGQSRMSQDPVTLFYGTTSGYSSATTQYILQQNVTPKELINIQGVDNNITSTLVSVNWTGISASQDVISGISGMGSTINFGYGDFKSNNSYFLRHFLKFVTDINCNSPINYHFNYTGETAQNDVYSIALPDSSSNQYDYWGYYSTHPASTDLLPAVYVNPSNAGLQRYLIKAVAGISGDYNQIIGAADRSVDPNVIASGTLSKVIYPTGGSSNINYEPNNYYDVNTATVTQGGGVRVAQVTDFDGTNNIVRSYSYNDPTTGYTSGRPVSLPSYAFTVPYTGTATGAGLWSSATVLSLTDLSPDNHQILYSAVKLSRPSAGSTVTRFYNTAMNNSNGIPGCGGCSAVDWVPTVNYVGRPTCASYGPIKNDTYSYPFTPNTNYDFERGLVQSVTSYNDAGTKVSETNYTYQRSGTPAITTGVKFENNGNPAVKSYAKYNLYTGTSELLTQTTTNLYDVQGGSHVKSKVVSNTYGSPYHKLPTKQTIVNSDNSTMITNTSYVKDYPNANINSNSAIYQMNLENENLPIETISQILRGAVSYTTNATLLTYATTVNSATYKPSQQFNFVSPDGVTDFAPYNVDASSSTKDSRYFISKNYTYYDYSGYVQTVDDAHKNVGTVITDHITFKPAATIKNATVREIAFIDFDSKLGDGLFILNDAGSYATGHTGRGLYMNSSETLTATINNNTTSGNYIFSAWINSSSAGSLTVQLHNSTGAAYGYSEGYTNTAGAWKYFEWKVPTGNMGSNFTVSIIPNTDVYVDDCLFYPEKAEANIASYDPITYFKTSQTNTNGVSTYYTYDRWGRLLYTFDQDKNIVERKEYINPLPGTALTASFTKDIDAPSPGVLITFSALNNPCIPGINFNWDFGDGSTASGISSTHSYSSQGDYVVMLTESAANFSNSAKSTTIHIGPPAISVVICQSGVIRWDNCSHTALNTASCGSFPNDDTHSYYNATVTGAIGTISYQWQTSTNSGATWTNVAGQTSSGYTVSRGANAVANWVRCVVSTTGVQSGTSDYVLFDVNSCH